VISEAIAGMTHVECSHHHIAGDLRENRGGSDAGGFSVTLNDRLLRYRYLFQAFRVDQEMLRSQSKPSIARRIASRPAQ
jgi:hypothetical protein